MSNAVLCCHIEHGAVIVTIETDGDGLDYMIPLPPADAKALGSALIDLAQRATNMEQP